MIRELPNTFRPKTPKGKKDALKATATLQAKQNAKRTVTFPKIGQTAIQNIKLTRTYTQRHTITEIVNQSRSNALVRSVKILLVEAVEELKLIDFTWPQPSLLVLPCYTQDICLVRVKGSKPSFLRKKKSKCRPDRKTIRAYTNVEAPVSFTQPCVRSRSSLLVIYL